MKYSLRLFFLLLLTHLPGSYLFAQENIILFIANTPEQDSVFENSGLEHGYFGQLRKEGYTPLFIKNIERRQFSISDLKRAWPEAKGLIFLGINPDYSKRCLLTIDDSSPASFTPWVSHIPTASAEETIEYLDLSLSIKLKDNEVTAFNIYAKNFRPEQSARLFKSHFSKRKNPLLAEGLPKSASIQGFHDEEQLVGEWFQKLVPVQIDSIAKKALRRIKEKSKFYMPVMNTEFPHSVTLAASVLVGASYYSRYRQGLPVLTPVDVADKIMYPIYYLLFATSSLTSGLLATDSLDEIYFWLYPNYWINEDYSHEPACAPVLLGDGTLSSRYVRIPGHEEEF